jgi:hypothetical protein
MLSSGRILVARLAILDRSRENHYWLPPRTDLVLEHRAVSNWQKLVDHLLADKEMLGRVRLTFRDLYYEIEGSSDPSAALEAFLGTIPAEKKTQ